VGLAVPVVAAPSEEHRAGQTGNHRPVAPPRIPALLALAFPVGSAAGECELRKLIREMSKANPLWGAPRIHGELLKLGIEFSQVTVAKYMVRRSGMPSPTWRSFLRNQGAGIAAIDMFVVVAASFRLLYVMVILAHDRRSIICIT